MKDALLNYSMVQIVNDKVIFPLRDAQKIVTKQGLQGHKVLQLYTADNFKDRLLGYMFRKKPHYEAILIKPCRSIHTFFMNFEIDVYFLDSDMKVIKHIRNLKPRRVIGPVKGAAAVMEVPSTSTKTRKLK